MYKLTAFVSKILKSWLRLTISVSTHDDGRDQKPKTNKYRFKIDSATALFDQSDYRYLSTEKVTIFDKQLLIINCYNYSTSTLQL